MCVHVVQWRQERGDVHLEVLEVRLLERVQRRLANLDNDEGKNIRYSLSDAQRFYAYGSAMWAPGGLKSAFRAFWQPGCQFKAEADLTKKVQVWIRTVDENAACKSQSYKILAVLMHH